MGSLSSLVNIIFCIQSQWSSSLVNDTPITLIVTHSPFLLIIIPTPLPILVGKMETPDQKTPSQPGHDGQVHFCHKCGWPFPNQHPSARHRRAHKKVCGTIDGYLLDNKSHLDVSDDGEHVSDDENKTPCGKVVERTISRKSSSGVGNQSARSEDEVFADAVTDFVDSPGFGEASYGVMSRGNPLQNVAELKVEISQLKEKNDDGDNLTASAIPPTDKELPTVNARALEGEFNEMKAMRSHDHISSPSNNLGDSGMEEHKADAPSKETVDRRISGIEHAGDNSEGPIALGDVSEESLDPVPVDGNVEVRGNEITEIKGVVECSHDVDTSSNLQDPVHSVQVVEPADENAGKVTDVFEECNSRTEANKYVHAVAAPDALCSQENPDISVENSDHKGGKFNIPMDSDATLTVESLEFGKYNASDESYTSTGFTKSGESNYVSYVGDAPKTVHSVEDMIDPELGSNQSMVEQITVGQEVQISDDKASDSDIIEFNSKDAREDIRKESVKDQEVSSCTEEKPVVSFENLSSKDEAAYGGDDQEMTAKVDVNTSDDFKHEDKKFVVDDNFSKVPAGELAVTNLTSAESFELTIDHGRHDLSYVEKVKIHDTSNENEVRVGGGEMTDSIEARTALDCGSTISGYSDKNDELFELENEYDQGELSKNFVSDNMAVSHSQPDSLPTLEDNMQEVQSKTGESTCAVEKSDDHIDSVLKTSEDALSSCPSSDVVINRGVKRAADNVPSVTEDDKITKKHSSVLVPDTGDSSSQTDSLEGNWGSVSVLSAISDAADMASSKNVQVLSVEATVSSEPKIQEDGPQPHEDKTAVESQSHPQVAVEESAGTSDIQTQHDGQQESSAGGSHIVSHGGKREKEIMAKVNDWDSGKQHTALKTLLVEAIARSRAESPNHDDDSTSVPKTDEVPRTNNGTENVIVSKNAETEISKEEIGKEWNSPARYPVNIKTEKKRGKSRPYWVPFLCCSSVNAR